MAAPRMIRCLALTVVLGCTLAACTTTREPGLWPTPSPPPSSSPSPSPASTQQTSARPPSVTVRIVASIQMSPPNDTVVDPKAHAVYLSDDAGTVSVLDTDRHEVVRRISVLGGSDGLAVDSGAGRLYVAHEGSGDSGAVSVINTRSLKVIKTIRLGKGGAPNGLAFDPRRMVNPGSQ